MKLFTNKKGFKMNKEQLAVIKYIVKKTEEAMLYQSQIDIEFEAGVQRCLTDEIEQYGRDIISILQSDN